MAVLAASSPLSRNVPLLVWRLVVLAACALAMPAPAAASIPTVNPLDPTPISLPVEFGAGSPFYLDLTDVTSAEDFARLEVVFLSNLTCAVRPSMQTMGECEDYSKQMPYVQLLRFTYCLEEKELLPGRVNLVFLNSTVGSCFDGQLFAQLSPIVPVSRVAGVQWSTQRLVPEGQLFVVFAEPDPHSRNGSVNPFAIQLNFTDGAGDIEGGFSVSNPPDFYSAFAAYMTDLNVFYLDSNCGYWVQPPVYPGPGYPVSAPVWINLTMTSQHQGNVFWALDVSVVDESARQPGSKALHFVYGQSSIFDVVLSAAAPYTNLTLTLVKGSPSGVTFDAGNGFVVGALTLNEQNPQANILLPPASATRERITLIITAQDVLSDFVGILDYAVEHSAEREMDM